MAAHEVVHLNIGELVIAGADHTVSTILGSCVSVCLFSKEKALGGIIHFALPTAPANLDPEDPAALRYGDTAMRALFQALVDELGGRKGDLVAKVVGGASGLSDAQHVVGPENIRMAEKVLAEYGVPVVGRDVGGGVGRKVVFHPGTGRLRVAALDAPAEPPKRAVPAERSALGDARVVVERKPAKRRVLVIDDSKTIRDLLTRILGETTDLEVVGVAENPLVAEKMLDKLKPDVLTLDVHMPEMDGLTFLEKLLPRHPIPVVMITSISREEGDTILRAMELGAIDYIQKPNIQEIKTMTPLIQEKVREASFARVCAPLRQSNSQTALTRSTTGGLDQGLVLAIGASTGGTEAIREVLTRLPADIPPIVIVQHIPPVFSTAFAQRLDSLCAFEVKEASDGDVLRPGLALIAPGGRQMAIVGSAGRYKVNVNDDPPMSRHKPSVDYLFQSVARQVGARAVGVILTGMGNDGAKGLLQMREKGARTLAQDEASSVVYGMPKSAFEAGAVESVHSLHKIPEAILKNLKRRASA